jgi:hypothetical protein
MPNRHQRRAAAKASKKKFAKPADPMDLPLVGIRFQRDGEGEQLMTFSPNSLRDYFVAATLAHEQRQPVSQETTDALAALLQVEPTARFRFEVIDIIVSTSLVVIKRYNGPREAHDTLQRLKNDPQRALAEGDNYTRLMARMIADSMSVDAADPLSMLTLDQQRREIIDQHQDAIREVIPRGRPKEEARAIFIEAIVELAWRVGDDLSLPQRGRGGEGTTKLFAFTSAMRELLLEYGQAMADQRGLPRGRFGPFERLSRDGLIAQLEAARGTVLREKSVAS